MLFRSEWTDKDKGRFVVANPPVPADTPLLKDATLDLKIPALMYHVTFKTSVGNIETVTDDVHHTNDHIATLLGELSDNTGIPITINEVIIGDGIHIITEGLTLLYKTPDLEKVIEGLKQFNV